MPDPVDPTGKNAFPAAADTLDPNREGADEGDHFIPLPVVNRLVVTEFTKVYIYYDTSGSLNGELPNLRAAIADLITLLENEVGLPPENVTEYNNGTERWAQWLYHNDDDYVVIAVINESNSIYHSTSSSEPPKSAYVNDYNLAYPALQAASNSHALIYGIESPSWGNQTEINTFFAHLQKAVDGTNGYPNNPTLASLGVQYRVNVPSGQSAEDYLADIEEFLSSTEETVSTEGLLVAKDFFTGIDTGTLWDTWADNKYSFDQLTTAGVTFRELG